MQTESQENKEKSKRLFFTPFKIIGNYNFSNYSPILMNSNDTAKIKVYVFFKFYYKVYNYPFLNETFESVKFRTPISCYTVIRRTNSEEGEEGDYVIIGTNKSILVMKKNRILFETELHTSRITTLVKIGNNNILSIDLDKNYNLFTPPFTSRRSTNQYSLDIILKSKKPFDFEYSKILHPVTYLDKILVLSRNKEELFLYNIRVSKLVYNFKNILQPNQKITIIKSLSVLDCVLAGFSNGTIVIFNLKSCKIIKKYKLENKIIDLDYFNNTLVSIDFKKMINIYNLKNNRIIIQEQQNTNNISLSESNFIKTVKHNEFLIFNNKDNAIYLMVFEDNRLIERNKMIGHSKTINKVLFIQDDFSKNSKELIISSGFDKSLRLTHLQSLQSVSFSQKNNIIKNHFSNFHFSKNKVISSHQNSSIVRIWNIKKRTIKKNKQLYVPLKEGIVSSIFIKNNYCLIGRNNGRLELWNAKSGQRKGYFKDDDLAPPSKMKKVNNLLSSSSRFSRPGLSHKSRVTGVCINKYESIICSIGFDGFIKFWNFQTFKLIKKIKVNTPLNKIKIQNDLIGISSDDFKIYLLDFNFLKIIRVFSDGHENKITDFCFYKKYLISSGMDRYLIIWSIIDNLKLNWIEVTHPILSLDCSEKYLITSHLDKLGFYLWGNNTIFLSNTSITTTPVYFKKDLVKVFLPDEVKKDIDDVYSFLDHFSSRVGNNNENNENLNKEEEMELEKRTQEWLLEEENEEEEIEENILIKLSNFGKEKRRAGTIYTIPYLDEIRNKNIRKRKRRKEDEEDEKVIPFFLPSMINEVNNIINDKEEIEIMKELDDDDSEEEEEEGKKKKENKMKDEEEEEKQKEVKQKGGIFFLEDDSEEEDEEEENEGEGENEDMKTKEEEEKEKEKNFYVKHLMSQNNVFLKHLVKEEFNEAMEFLKNRTNKEIDLEIRSLSSYSNNFEMVLFLKFIYHFIQNFSSEFDFIEVLINLFLKAHAQVIVSNNENIELFELVSRIKDMRKKKWEKLKNFLVYSQCVAKMLVVMQ